MIEAVGAGVDPGRVGERVWLWNAAWQRAFGTAAELVALPQAQAVPLPEGTSFAEGACLGIPAVTAWYALFGDGADLAGQTVLVTGGAGTVGRYACQMAKIAGARVIATVLETEKAEALLARCFRGRMTARAALECALADLEAQRHGRGLADHWHREAGLDGVPSRTIAVQALVGGETPQAVFDSAVSARRRGHSAYKLKLAVSQAARDLTVDFERVAALREAVGRKAQIRLDANEAWSLDDACKALIRLAEFDVDYVEQPVARDDLEALARLDAEAPMRVAADEALLGRGLERCLERRAARIFIVKPAAIGGFDASRRLLERTRSAGIRIIWSSLLDGAISRLAALQLAAALGPSDEVHGLGTGPWLANDFPGGPGIEAGSLAVPNLVGLGLQTPWHDRAAFDIADACWVGPTRSFGADR